MTAISRVDAKETEGGAEHCGSRSPLKAGGDGSPVVRWRWVGLGRGWVKNGLCTGGAPPCLCPLGFRLHLRRDGGRAGVGDGRWWRWRRKNISVSISGLPASMPAALTPIPDPPPHHPPPPHCFSRPPYNFSLGASYKPTIYLHYAPEIAICRFAGKK